MTDDPENDAHEVKDTEERPHRFSEGQGFTDTYEGFDLDPPELDVDLSKVDPVDSRALTDMLDERQIPNSAVDADRLVDVGLEYIQIKRYEQATETLERAARLTDDPLVEQEAWVNKGAAHAELEEFDEAIGAYREALHVEEDTETRRDSGRASAGTARSEHAATAETNLAYALWESGQTEQALDHAERAVEIDPRFGQAWYNRGFFLAERGLNEEAVDYLDNAIRLGFDNAEVLEEKAAALEQLGEDEEAERLSERADEIRKRAEDRLVE